MKKMENMKADIEKDYNNYILSTEKSRSILDRRESDIARNEILRKSKDLLVFTQKCLKNDDLIRSVSNSKNTYNEYQKYANEMISKFK